MRRTKHGYINENKNRATGPPPSPWSQAASRCVLFFVVAAANASDATDRLLVDYTRELANWTRWLAVGTGVVAFGTGVLAFFAIKQSKDTKRALEATETTIQHGQLRERAYVFVESVDTSAKRWISELDQFFWTFKLVNHGRTPAIIGSIKAAATVNNRRPWQSEDDRKLSHSGSSFKSLEPQDFWEERIAQPTAMVLASGEESKAIVCFSTRPIPMQGVPNEAFDAVWEGVQHMFWISGKVEYEDVFGVSHQTSFCFMLEPRDLGTAVAFELGDGKTLNSRT